MKKTHAASSLHDDQVGALCNQPDPEEGTLELTAEVADVTCLKCIGILGREDV